MEQKERDYFDRQVEWVLDRLPEKILRILQETPLHVEDQPAEDLWQELEITDAEELCGCFSGTPYTESSVFTVGALLPNIVTIFRRGIIAASRDEFGKVRRTQLRQQIRITILHELAHLHGMDEDEIIERGYG
jgi:predicted Zn-dependent protease with MMP-like domain